MPIGGQRQGNHTSCTGFSLTVYAFKMLPTEMIINASHLFLATLLSQLLKKCPTTHDT